MSDEQESGPPPQDTNERLRLLIADIRKEQPDGTAKVSRPAFLRQIGVPQDQTVANGPMSKALERFEKRQALLPPFLHVLALDYFRNRLSPADILTISYFGQEETECKNLHTLAEAFSKFLMAGWRR